MIEIRVVAYRSIPLGAEVVYRCLADFEQAHQHLLPDNFREYEVVSGGFGEGTVVSCTATIRGQDRRFFFRIGEPIPTKAMTAYDHDSHLTLTYHMRSTGLTTEVEIDAYWTQTARRFGFVVNWWAQIVVKRMLNQILSQIPKVCADLDLDRPTRPAVP